MSTTAPTALQERLIATLRVVPDFPSPGIMFQDVTPVLADAALLREAMAALAEPWRDAGVTHVAGIESRGFIFGAAVADRIGSGFTPVRKAGKLPSKTVRETYALEYGTDTLEIHDDGIRKGQRVLIVDDLLATGGTARATVDLVRRLGGDVLALAFLIELVALNGRDRLSSETVHSVLRY